MMAKKYERKKSEPAANPGTQSQLNGNQNNLYLGIQAMCYILSS